MSEFSVGLRVHSVHGPEHVGTIVAVKAFSDGRPMYHVRRDSDGFVWIGWPGTLLPAASLN